MPIPDAAIRLGRQTSVTGRQPPYRPPTAEDRTPTTLISIGRVIRDAPTCYQGRFSVDYDVLLGTVYRLITSARL